MQNQPPPPCSPPYILTFVVIWNFAWVPFRHHRARYTYDNGKPLSNNLGAYRPGRRPFMFSIVSKYGTLRLTARTLRRQLGSKLRSVSARHTAKAHPDCRPRQQHQQSQREIIAHLGRLCILKLRIHSAPKSPVSAFKQRNKPNIAQMAQEQLPKAQDGNTGNTLASQPVLC